VSKSPFFLLFPPIFSPFFQRKNSKNYNIDYQDLVKQQESIANERKLIEQQKKVLAKRKLVDYNGPTRKQSSSTSDRSNDSASDARTPSAGVSRDRFYETPFRPKSFPDKSVPLNFELCFMQKQQTNASHTCNFGLMY
jgi:hypothetical protein